VKFCFIISFVFYSYCTLAQGSTIDTLSSKGTEKVVSGKHKVDSIKSGVHTRFDTLHIPGDSARRSAVQKADSIRHGFEQSIDSLQTEYQNTFSKLDSQQQAIQNKIDSLTTLHLPTDKLTKKLDSLKALRPQKVTEFTQKAEQLKSKTTAELKQVNLPPELQEPMQKITQSIQGYSLPGIGDKMNGLDLPPSFVKTMAGDQFKLPELENLKLPDVKNMDVGKLDNVKLPDGTKLPDINGMKPQMEGLKDLTGKVGEYGQEVKNVTSQLNEGGVDKVLDNQVTKIDAIQDLQKNAGEFSGMTGSLDEEAVKNKMKEMAMKEAMADVNNIAKDHFAGKEQELQKAMQSMSKLKSKYKEIKSLSEIPKRVPNPMKGKPLIERIVPGLTFLIMKKDFLLLDVNPLIRFRFTGKFTAGIGWNQRLAFDGWNLKDRSLIYGPRSVFEYKWGKGFHFLFTPEIMKTSIPPQLLRTPTESNKQWVPGMFGGLKKEFTVYKKIKGNSEMLYNLYNTHGRSPYADRFVIRFGFEFPLKKRKIGGQN
jgi:hypothetical protein